MNAKRKPAGKKKLSDFRAQENNLNTHTQRGMSMLESSMNEVGYAGPMVAANDGEIIDGSAYSMQAVSTFPGSSLFSDTGTCCARPATKFSSPVAAGKRCFAPSAKLLYWWIAMRPTSLAAKLRNLCSVGFDQICRSAKHAGHFLFSVSHAFSMQGRKHNSNKYVAVVLERFKTAFPGKEIKLLS